MRIEALDPAFLAAETAKSLADLRNAAASVEAPHLAPVSGEHVRLRLRHGWDDRPTTHLFAAVCDSDAIAGFAELEFPVWDNHHMAYVDLETHPDHLDAAGELLETVVSTTRVAGRTLLLSDAWAGSPREALLRSHDFSVASRTAQRRLVLADLDWPALDRLHDESRASSSDYDIVALPTPAPADLMPGLLDLQRAMNDAPLDDLELDDDVWTVERLRGSEQAMANRHIRLHRLLARRRSDGALGGHTVVAVEAERPWLGFQEDTAVVRGHRGHRLGLRLKVEMLERLATLEPQINQIDTWNAESNTHMLAVNDAIGCVVVARAHELQKRLTP